MKEKKKTQVKVKTYADTLGLTTAAIYKQIKNGTVKAIKIDGMTFIEI